MNLVNLKRVADYQVEDWIKNHIKDLSPYQKEWIRNEEIIRFAPFYFMERRKKTSNVLIRFSIIIMLVVLLLMVISLPFNFFITGSWGYDHEKLKWYSKWVSACGL